MSERENYWNRLGGPIRRREFLRGSAVVGGAAAGAILIGCSDDEGGTPATATGGGGGGTGTAAATTTGSADGAQDNGGTIRYAADSMSPVASPRATSSATHIADFHTTGDGLVWMGADGNLVPELGLFETWEQASDTTIVAKLRPNITFHDGSPFTSESVVAHFNIINDVERSPQYGFRVHVASLDTVETTDELTVQMNLSEPDSTFLNALGASAGIPFSTEAYERLGDDELVSPLLTGPYQVESFDPDDRFVFTRYDNYWGKANGGPPYADSIERVFIADMESKAAALETGQIDVAWFDGETVRRLQDTDLQALTYRGVTLAYYMNVGQPPFDDERVRKAHAHALDRDLIVEAAYAGLALPQPSWIPPGVSGHSDYEPYPHDPAEARKYIDAVGGPVDLTFRYPTSGDVRFTEQVTVMYQQFWNEVGFNVSLGTFANGPEAQKEMLDDLSHPIAWVYGTGMATRPDPGLQIINFLSSNTRFNPSRESGIPEVQQLDDLISDIKGTFDSGEREGYILEAQKIARDAVYAQMPITNSEYWVFAGNHVGGFDHPQFANPIAGPAIRPRFLWRREG